METPEIIINSKNKIYKRPTTRLELLLPSKKEHTHGTSLDVFRWQL